MFPANLCNLSLPALPLTDIIIPNLYAIFAVPAAVGMFFVVCLVEALVLRWLLPNTKPWRDAFLVNLISTLLGWVTVIGRNPFESGLPQRAAWLLGAWVLSVLVEGMLLALLERQASRNKIAVASLSANSLSYLLLALVVLWVPRDVFEDESRFQERCVVEYQVLTWEDVNQNGLPEPGEPPLSLVQFYLDEPLAGSGTQHTDASGIWQGSNMVLCEPGTPPAVTKTITVIAPAGCMLTTPKEVSAEPYRFGFVCQQAASSEQVATRAADYQCRNANAASITEALDAYAFEESLALSDCLLSRSSQAAELWKMFYAARGDAHAGLQDIPAAVADYQKALEVNDASGDVEVYNHACWYIGLYGDPQQALDYCEQAVAKAKTDAYWREHLGFVRDSRGLVYTRLGRYQEAAADFQVYIDELENTTDPAYLAKREQRLAWVESLQAGQNPFTPELLETLRGQ